MFRGSATNMAVTDVSLPTDPETTGLLWNHSFGTGWNSVPSVPIIAENSLIVMSSTNLYRLDLKSGEIIATGTMAAEPNWGNTPPTYAEGMIFCPLSGGRVQAFDAQTLESLWIYQDPLGGQALTPILYSDGFVYTGFWRGEEKDAAFVAIPAEDGNSSRTDEAKDPAWRYVQKGGFYWTCPVSVGDSVIVGTDDGGTGSTGTGHVCSFRKETGELISSLDVSGDQRSGIAFDEESGRIYFMTKSGWLCSAAADSSTGALSDLKTVRCGEMSSSTPVVYKGRVYFGMGEEITSSGSQGAIAVADAGTLDVIYKKELKGYPQCSLLLTTAYEEQTGYLYFYSTYNASPGGISVLRTTADADGADDAEVYELYDAAGFEQYCAASLICGEDGTIYYKNDSGNILAIGTGGSRENEDAGTDSDDGGTSGSGTGGTDSASGESEDSGTGDASVSSTAGETGNSGSGETGSAATADGEPSSSGENAENRSSTDPEVSAIISAIRELAGQTDPPEDQIIDVYQRYEALSESQKAQVSNYQELCALTDRQGIKNHTDEKTGLSVSGAAWYLRLEVQEISDGDNYQAIRGGIASNDLISMWDVRLVNTLTGEEESPQTPVTLSARLPESEDERTYQIVRISADGRLEYPDCTVGDGAVSWTMDSHSEFALIGGNSGELDTLDEEETGNALAGTADAEASGSEDAGRSYVPWIVLAAAGAAALILLVVFRKCSGKEGRESSGS